VNFLIFWIDKFRHARHGVSLRGSSAVTRFG
jgi:hypothetical protein